MRISRLLTYDMAIRCLVKVFNNECYYQSTTVTSKLYLVNCMWNNRNSGHKGQHIGDFGMYF